MRSVLRVSIVLPVVFCLTMTASLAMGAVVETSNLFQGKTAVGDAPFNSTYVISNVVDGTLAAAGFLDGQTENRISISGFNSDIYAIRFFESGFTQRTSPSVDIYYSSAVMNSLDTEDYTYLGHFDIPSEYIENIDGGGSWGHRYLNDTDPPQTGPGTQLWPVKWSELTGLGIPSGTQSVLLDFAPDNWWQTTGVFFCEIQGFASPPPKPGDANRDHFVNMDDAETLAENWLQSGKVWDQGDFNGDGIVNDIDATLMAANWSVTSPSSSVPEPAGLAYIAAMVLAFAAYRHRAN